MKWVSYILLSMVTACAPAYAGGHTDYPGMGAMGLPYTLDNPAGPITTEEPRYQHGAMNAGYGPYYVEIAPGEDHFATVTFQNRLTYGPSTVNDVTFIIDGLSVRTLVSPGDGDLPDVLEVFPPAGFIAIPSSDIVEENEIGVIEIHEMVLG